MGSGPGNQARVSHGLAEVASGYGDPVVRTEAAEARTMQTMGRASRAQLTELSAMCG